MKVVVVLMEPEKPVNLGLISRLADNFEVDELRFVNPKLSSEEWGTARIFSSHSSHRLKEHYTFPDLHSAISGASLSVATSAWIASSTDNILRRAIDVDTLRRYLTETRVNELAVVFGRDGCGLTSEEISVCDLLLNIEASPDYRTLNIAAAVAIIIHQLYRIRRLSEGRPLADRKLRVRLVDRFDELALYSGTPRHKVMRSVTAFSRLVHRGRPDDREAALLLGVLRRTVRKLTKMGTKDII